MEMTLLYSICVIAIYSFACFGFGQFSMSAIRPRHHEIIPDYIFSVSAFVLGQAVLAAIWIPIGLLGQLNVITVTFVISIGIIIFIFCDKAYSPLISAALKSGWEWLLHTDMVFRIICLGMLGLLFLFFLSAALTGPLGDAEAFYMTYPKVMAASGYLTEMPGIYSEFSQIGLLAELHFAVLMKLGVAEVSKLFVWPVAVSAGLILTAICVQVGLGKRGQWIAFIILFTSTGFTNHIWDGKVEVFPVALSLAAVYWIMLEEKISKTSLRLIGLFSGFAMVAKFSYIPVLIPSFFLLISWRLYISIDGLLNLREYFQKLAKHSLVLGVWVFLAWIPHLIKNWVIFDAPLAPFIGENSEILNQSWFSSEDTAWIIKTYPLALVFGRYPMQGGNLSFLWLTFLPLVFFLPKAKSFIRSPLTQITMAGVIGVAIWMLLRPSVIAPRYIFISLALLIPLVAWGAEQLYEKEERPYFLRTTILITTLFAFLFISYPHIQNTVVKKIRNSAVNEKCALSGSFCSSFNKLNSIANLGARMYFAGYYGYWARPDMLQCQLSHSEMQSLERIKDANERWMYLLEQGVEYVVVDRLSHAQMAQELGSTIIPSWLIKESIVDSQELIVWKIHSSDPDHSAKAKCSVVNSDNWKVYESHE